MHEINAPLGADRKHKSRDRPIVEVNNYAAAGIDPGSSRGRQRTCLLPHENGTARKADETVFNRDETRLKPTFAGFLFSQIAGSTLLGIIINLFYRQSCRATLSAIRMQSRFWA